MLLGELIKSQRKSGEKTIEPARETIESAAFGHEKEAKLVMALLDDTSAKPA